MGWDEYNCKSLQQRHPAKWHYSRNYNKMKRKIPSELRFPHAKCRIGGSCTGGLCN